MREGNVYPLEDDLRNTGEGSKVLIGTANVESPDEREPADLGASVGDCKDENGGTAATISSELHITGELLWVLGMHEKYFQQDCSELYCNLWLLSIIRC